jgi:amidase
MARTVRDAAKVLGVIADGNTDYTAGLQRGALKGKRIGVYTGGFGFDRRVDRIIEEQITVLQALGAEIVGTVDIAAWDELGSDFRIVSLYEFKAGLNEYLSGLGPDVKVRSLKDLIEFNREHPVEEAMSYMGQDMLLQAQEKGLLSEEPYQKALARLQARSNLSRVLRERELDAILAPSNGPAWTIDFVNGDHFEGGNSASAAIAGCPHITVPAGSIHGLPIGLSLYGPKHSEKTLLAMAYDYEQETGHRLDPRVESKNP